jgi:hypothetical protein
MHHLKAAADPEESLERSATGGLGSAEDSMDDRMPLSPPLCIDCGALTTLATVIAPLGNAAGHNIFRCGACGKLAWADVPVPSGRPSL